MADQTLDQRSFYRNVIRMMTPIAGQNLITIAVNIIDSLMLRRVSEAALSASSLAGQYFNLFQILCLGLGTGASILASRYWGRKDLVNLRKTITIMFRITLFFAAIFAALSFAAPAWIMRMYTDEEELIGLGAVYLRIGALTFFFHGLAQTGTIVMRSVRKVGYSFAVSVGAFFLNVVGNYILIYGKLGLHPLGIAGASLATTIARGFEFVMIFGYMVLKERNIGYRVQHLALKTADLLPEYLRICLPVLLSDGILALGNNVITMIIGRMGTAFIAATAVSTAVERVCTAWSSGIGQTGAVMIGNTIGEGKRELVCQQGRALLKLGTAVGLLACLVILALRTPVLALYRFEGETLAISRQLLNMSSIVVIFQCIGSILTKGVFRGGGDTKALLAVDNCFLWLCSIPLGAICGLRIGLPAGAVYFLLNIHHLLKSIWGVFHLRKNNWIKKIDSIE